MDTTAPSSQWRPVLVAASAILALIVVWLIIRGPHDEFATLNGHHEGVFSLALAPDGKTIASGGGDGTVRIWNLADRRELAVLKGHTGRVHALAWTPDGTTLASSSEDKTIRLWNPTSGKESELFTKVPKIVHALAYSSDGTILAAAVDRDVCYWKLNAHRELMVLHGHWRTISGMAFLPGKSELATFANDQTVRIWDLETDRQVAEMPGPMGHCYSLTVSTDGKLIACVGGGRVHLYDAENRQPLDPVEPNSRLICGVALSPDGKLLAIGSQDKEVVIWDLQQKKVLSRLNGHQFAVGQMAFLPDSQTLVTSSHDSSLKLWKVR